MLKVVKSIAFLLLAILVFVGFNYPLFAVPKKFDVRTRELVDDRIGTDALSVDQQYFEQSVREVLIPRLPTVYRTAFCIASALALIAFCVSMRPPHDCGGLNLFNPIALIPIAAVSLLTGVVITLALSAHKGAGPSELQALLSELTAGYAYGENRLMFVVIVPAVLEGVFFGFIFSFLERIHPIPALLLTPVAFAVTVYSVASGYAKYTGAPSAIAYSALSAALIMGAVHALLTFRFRSVIPAVLSHMLIALLAGRISGFCQNGAAPLSVFAAVLVILLTALMLLPALLGKKHKVFAYDFPFTKHHERMNGFIYTPLLDLDGQDGEDEEEPEKSEKPSESAKKAEEKKKPQTARTNLKATKFKKAPKTSSKKRARRKK